MRDQKGRTVAFGTKSLAFNSRVLESALVDLATRLHAIWSCLSFVRLVFLSSSRCAAILQMMHRSIWHRKLSE
ncbi:Uncharacterized protein APZ42_021611 [Daphnia magna]|uniref:Uncharacterized protein n=1 Tax=Daphnia magna TaxID=35525 RepID=A0A164WIP6_9CRUS|nr:Uncharacterized protein APZ42_021611 [Daphnia magna]